MSRRTTAKAATKKKNQRVAPNTVASRMRRAQRDREARDAPPKLNYSYTTPAFMPEDNVPYAPRKADSGAASVELMPADLEYIGCMTDPFGQGTGLGPMAACARIPDGFSDPTLPLTFYGVTTFSGSTSTHVHVAGCVPTTNVAIGQTAYAANETGATLLANGAQVYAKSATIATSLLASNYFRVVQSAIRIIPISPSISTSGVVRAGRTRRVHYNGSAYSSNDFNWADLTGETFTLSDGLTVRGNKSETFCDFIAAPASTSFVNHIQDFFLTPVAFISGMSSTTVIQIEFVVHVELRASPGMMPFRMSPSPTSDYLGTLASICSQTPFATRGNSFKSILRALARSAKRNAGAGLLFSRAALMKDLPGMISAMSGMAL